MLVDHAGRILLQLRDAHAPVAPNQWGAPGGTVEPGEEPEAGARRELLEETGLRVEGSLALFWHDRLPSDLEPCSFTEWYVYCAGTTARQEEIVLGEGAAMTFLMREQALTCDLGGSAAYFVPLFLASAEYRRLAERTAAT
jgi:8-oxo-dGTP pyrophosphatase MutT (NUDIX family)